MNSWLGTKRDSYFEFLLILSSGDKQNLLGVSIARIITEPFVPTTTTTCDVGNEDHGRIVVSLTVFDLLRHPSAPLCLLTWKIGWDGRINSLHKLECVLLKTIGGWVCLVEDGHHIWTGWFVCTVRICKWTNGKCKPAASCVDGKRANLSVQIKSSEDRLAFIKV
jgi:hypothetical protein